MLLFSWREFKILVCLIQAAFRLLVGAGYQTLQSLLLDFCKWIPSPKLLDALLDMLVDGAFDINEKTTIKVRSVMILPDLLHSILSPCILSCYLIFVTWFCSFFHQNEDVIMLLLNVLQKVRLPPYVCTLCLYFPVYIYVNWWFPIGRAALHSSIMGLWSYNSCSRGPLQIELLVSEQGCLVSFLIGFQ